MTTDWAVTTASTETAWFTSKADALVEVDRLVGIGKAPVCVAVPVWGAATGWPPRAARATEQGQGATRVLPVMDRMVESPVGVLNDTSVIQGNQGEA